MIAVDLGGARPPGAWPTHLGGVLRATARVGRRVANGGSYEADIVIRPDTAAVRRIDPRRSDELEQAGEAATDAALPTIRSVLDKHHRPPGATA